MTEAEIRKKYIDCAKSYYGAERGNTQHKAIVDAYNSVQPHPRGYKLNYTDSWCAAFVSAVAVLCCMTDIIPVECSCSEQIKLWQKMGRWIEADYHRPEIGDLLYYDWQDGKDYAKTDNQGAPDHVGIVVWTSGDNLLILEGNKGSVSVCGYREMNVNGRYIRGYGCPDYASKATPDEQKETDGNCTVSIPVLRYGMKSEAVRALQNLLILHGAIITVDGSFGPKTRAAVYAFQMEHELTVDGSVGPLTWAALIG